MLNKFSPSVLPTVGFELAWGSSHERRLLENQQCQVWFSEVHRNFEMWAGIFQKSTSQLQTTPHAGHASQFERSPS